MYVGKFEKVSREEWERSVNAYITDVGEHLYRDAWINAYDRIVIPYKSTLGSAGYDFTIPSLINFVPGIINPNSIIPTGIKVKLDPGYHLEIFPRSSMGIKYGFTIANTVGIIDSDYYNNVTNEGHILVALNRSYVYGGNNEPIDIDGKFVQGVCVKQYEIETVTDHRYIERSGGIGSTGK